MMAGHSNGQPSTKMMAMISASFHQSLNGTAMSRVGDQRRRAELGEDRAEHVRGDRQEQHHGGRHHRAGRRVVDPLEVEAAIEQGQQGRAEGTAGGCFRRRRQATEDGAEREADQRAQRGDAQDDRAEVAVLEVRDRRQQRQPDRRARRLVVARRRMGPSGRPPCPSAG